MERIGEDVRRELGRFGSAGVMAELVTAWPKAVGEPVAANAWPARLARDRTLHVSTSSSAWAFELQQLEAEIAEQLRGILGAAAPARLRFAPGPLPEPPRPSDERRPVRPAQPSLEQAREAKAWATAIASEDLRKTVEKAARMSLARATADRAV
jgi:hypothetical protein